MQDQIITRFIGIDAGVRTGFAIWDSNRSLFNLIKSFSFFECLHSLLLFKQQAEEEKFSFAVVIEDPNANRPTFRQHGGNQFVRERISQNVGANKRDAALIHEFCDLHSIASFLIRPTKKSLTKLSAAEFKEYTQWAGGGDQHARDAAGLIFGMKPIRIRPEKLQKKPPVPLFLPINSKAAAEGARILQALK